MGWTLNLAVVAIVQHHSTPPDFSTPLARLAGHQKGFPTLASFFDSNEVRSNIWLRHVACKYVAPHLLHMLRHLCGYCWHLLIFKLNFRWRSQGAQGAQREGPTTRNTREMINFAVCYHLSSDPSLSPLASMPYSNVKELKNILQRITGEVKHITSQSCWTWTTNST